MSTPNVYRFKKIYWMVACMLIFSTQFCTGQFLYSITEEVDEGTFVGNIAKDLNLNAKEFNSKNPKLVIGTNMPYFDFDSRTGVIKTNGRIDREDMCANADKCSIDVEVQFSNPVVIHPVEITIFDINDNAPSFGEAFHILNITEFSIAGDRFSLPTANDADTGLNVVKNYNLNKNEHFSIDVQSNGEQSMSAELVLQKPLDREKQASINLILTAVDGGKPSRSGTLQIAVNVIDVNDNAPIFSQSVYKARVEENSKLGTSVTSVTAEDIDEGTNSKIEYSITGKAGMHSLFAIDKLTGEITVNGIVDHEENAAYEIRVQAKDEGIPPRIAHSKVLVEIVDLNDNAPEIIVKSLSGEIDEGSKKGTVVASINLRDKDSGKNGIVKSEIIGNVPFKLLSSYKNYYSIVVDGRLDRERQSEYNVTIVATDEGTPSLTAIGVIPVHISDANDNSPFFSEPEYYLYLKENSPVYVSIGSVKASDPDLNENSRITYTLLDHTMKPSSSSFLYLNSETGEIQSKHAYNYEEHKHIQFQVQAKDSGVPPLSSNVTVNVFILDENDNSPVILSPYSDQGSVNSENVPYSAEAGYFVAKIRAVDADSGYNALLSYHITEPKGTTLFRIGTSNGEIRTKRRMSDNDLKTHPLVIVVSDNGEPSLSATVSMDVVVVENTADMQTTFKQQPSKEDSFSDLNLYLLISVATVSVIFLLTLISLIAVKCHRKDHFSKYNAPMITTHPDGSWSYSKSTQQYDVCFSSDTMKSDVVVFPTTFPPADGELISINGGDTFNRTRTLPTDNKVGAC